MTVHKVLTVAIDLCQAAPVHLTYGSLCSGYGGLDLAIEAEFGATATWHSEVDPRAAALMEAHWPGVPNLGDLTTLDWSEVTPVDIICGGYPCQPFSAAGLRQGTNDARHLWPHIANALRVLRPRYAVFENVGGHLSLGFDRVLSDLDQIGYVAEWSLVRAADVGAPHRRERLLVVAFDPRGGGSGAPSPDARCERLGQHPGGAPAEEAGAAAGHESADHRGLQPAFDWRATPYGPAIARWESVTGRPAPHPRPGGKLSSEFVEWMMGLPLGWVTGQGLSYTAEHKALGNGVVVHQAAAAIRALRDRLHGDCPPSVDSPADDV